MALGTNRDYKTRDRSARAHISVHMKRIDQLVSVGVDKETASERAHDEIKSGVFNADIKKEIERIKNIQNHKEVLR